MHIRNPNKGPRFLNQAPTLTQGISKKCYKDWDLEAMLPMACAGQCQSSRSWRCAPCASSGAEPCSLGQVMRGTACANCCQGHIGWVFFASMASVGLSPLPALNCCVALVAYFLHLGLRRSLHVAVAGLPSWLVFKIFS